MSGILDVCSELSVGDRGSFQIDYIGKGNVWVNNTYTDSVIQLVNYLMVRALKDTAPGQLSIVGYDSDLSGLFAPFASLSSGESRILELISDEKAFKEYLNYIWQHIQAVQNVIQGRDHSLIEFRKRYNRPIECYKLVVLSIDMGMIDNETRSKLSMIMRSGPDNGVTFLIISTTVMTIQMQGGHDIELSVEAIAPNITVLETTGSSVSILDTDFSVNYPVYTADQIIQECSAFQSKSKTSQLPVIRFNEIHDMNKTWNYSSIEGLTFSIGLYGINRMDITIGDEINQRHNAIITGAVGQGKSNLISMIIHSLSHRYSPKELQMFLLDFKEGVTFKAFSNIGKDDYLPHAKALGLETDPSFGFAVLNYLYQEYQRRMKILKDYCLRSIRDLREQNPSIVMPRILVVIDEFQLMFDDEQMGVKIADLLEKSVRLFRAVGIHFILASQTLSDTSNFALAQKKDSLFSQVPIRIALKNSIAESHQTLGINNSAAAFLRPREAIVNLDYGEVSQNRKTIIAYADENALQPLRKIWWDKAKSAYPAPYVFESEKRITIQNGFEAIKKYRTDSRKPIVLLGDKISISGEHICIPVTNDMGRNIAIIGTPDSTCNNADGILQSIAVSLAAQHPKGNARFIFCDFSCKDMSYDKKYAEFGNLMENMGFFIESVRDADFEKNIKELFENDNNDDSVYIFGSGMDRWEYEQDPYGQGSILKKIVEGGPARNIHFFGWWLKVSNYNAQVSGYGNTDAFNTKVFLRTDERTVQSLTNPFVRWAPKTNRALVSDSVEFNEETEFVPYAPVTKEDVVTFKGLVLN